MQPNYNQLLRAILDIAESMQNSGAEVSRLEDSISRMCEAYQVARVNTFTITSNIIVTLEVDNETVITQTRRIHQCSNDFAKLDQLNDLCRYICANAPAAGEIETRYRAITAAKAESPLLFYVGAVLAGCAFTVFFGGTLRDIPAAALLSFLIESLYLCPVKNQFNSILYLFLTSFVSGVCAYLLVFLGLGVQFDKIIIGCIMLTIPGISITNSIRDLLSGDTISGISRLSESILQAGGIAGGFALAIYWCGRGF